MCMCLQVVEIKKISINSFFLCVYNVGEKTIAHCYDGIAGVHALGYEPLGPQLSLVGHGDALVLAFHVVSFGDTNTPKMEFFVLLNDLCCFD